MPIRGRYSPFDIVAFNKRLQHTLLIDMPSGATSDHDATYLNLDGNNGDQVFIDFDTTAAPATEPEGRVWWNGTDKTLNIATGVAGTVIQAGQEFLFRVFNNTGADLTDGKVVHPTGAVTIDGTPHVEYAQADTFENCFGTLAVITGTITTGNFGFATGLGKVRDIDTSGLSTGFVYLDDTVAGNLTSTPPEFPDYRLLIGGVGVVDGSNGNVTVSATDKIEDTVLNFWNGTFRESFDFRVTEAGGTVTGTLTPTNGHDDMTMVFSDGFTLLDTSPSGATIDLTPYVSADSNVVETFVYILQSAKVMEASNADWPTAEHIRVAHLGLQTAALTGTSGALRNQNINDHIQSTVSNQGHESHIGQRIRAFPAEWDDGTEATLDAGGQFISVTGGKVFQMHLQTFSAQSMPTDNIHVVNDPDAAYTTITNLDSILKDSTGAALSNAKFYSLVIWGVANKTGEESHMMLNLPSGSYNSEALAMSDSLGFANYTIPKSFKGVGFLIARFILRFDAPGWTYGGISTGYQDLRGFIPNSSAGSGAGASGITTLLGLTDTPAAYGGEALKILQVAAGETAMEFTADPTLDSVKLNDDDSSATLQLLTGQLAGVDKTLTFDTQDKSGTFLIAAGASDPFSIALGEWFNQNVMTTADVIFNAINVVGDVVISNQTTLAADGIAMDSSDPDEDFTISATNNDTDADLILDPDRTVIIDLTGPEVFVARKNNDAGDVFAIDTTNSKVTITGELDVDTLNFNGNVISDSTTGIISFDDDNLLTTGDITGGGFLTLNQDQDGPRFGNGVPATGIRVVGFDDENDRDLNLSITQDGHSVIGGSAVQMNISPGNSLVGSFTSLGFTFGNDMQFKFGSSSTQTAILEWNTSQTVNTLALGLDDNSALTGRYLLIADENDISANFNFAHTAQTNPTIFLHSANQSTDEWISLTHDQTDGVISTGTGDLNLTPAGNKVNVAGDLDVTGLSTLQGVITNIVTKVTGQSPYAVLETDYTILLDATGGNVTALLPGTPNQGQTFVIASINADNVCTIDRNSNNIEGAGSNPTLSVLDSWVIQFDSTFGWKRL